VNLPEIAEKIGDWSGTSVKERAPSDLTASILATFPRMSNMFLHYRQAIESRATRELIWKTKLWKEGPIRFFKLLNM
jgi:hypothetical protein